MRRGACAASSRADLALARDVRPSGPLRRAIDRLFDGPRTNAPRVAALMTTDVRSVDARTPIAELVPMFAHFGHHHIPVIDHDARLVGMITEADLIAGLYRQSFTKERQSA